MRTSVEDQFAQFRQTGDPDCLAAVFDLAAPKLLRTALHLSRDPASAEDALQATFVTAIEKADTWDSSRPVLPWLHGILVRHVRRTKDVEARSSASVVGTSTWPRAPAADPAAAAAQHETVALLRYHIEGLSEVYRQVLLLRLHHGLQPIEIGIGGPSPSFSPIVGAPRQEQTHADHDADRLRCPGPIPKRRREATAEPRPSLELELEREFGATHETGAPRQPPGAANTRAFAVSRG